VYTCAHIPTVAEIKALTPPRQAALHPGSQRILGVELRRLLALPGGLERLIVDLWADRQLARGCMDRHAIVLQSSWEE
jgi:hypothetical protein